MLWLLLPVPKPAAAVDDRRSQNNRKRCHGKSGMCDSTANIQNQMNG